VWREVRHVFEGRRERGGDRAALRIPHGRRPADQVELRQVPRRQGRQGRRAVRAENGTDERGSAAGDRTRAGSRVNRLEGWRPRGRPSYQAFFPRGGARSERIVRARPSARRLLERGGMTYARLLRREVLDIVVPAIAIALGLGIT